MAAGHEEKESERERGEGENERRERRRETHGKLDPIVRGSKVESLPVFAL